MLKISKSSKSDFSRKASLKAHWSLPSETEILLKRIPGGILLAGYREQYRIRFIDTGSELDRYWLGSWLGLVTKDNLAGSLQLVLDQYRKSVLARYLKLVLDRYWQSVLSRYPGLIDHHPLIYLSTSLPEIGTGAVRVYLMQKIPPGWLRLVPNVNLGSTLTLIFSLWKSYRDLKNF